MRGAALIILAWNQWPLTRRCLDSLLATDLDQAEIIVVDNGSSDATPTALEAYGERIRRVRLDSNLGFVRGMNAGIAAARAADDVVLLNNDLVFAQRDWLNRLRDAAYAAPDHGIVGCRQRSGDARNLLYHLGGFIEPESLHGQQTESGLQEFEAGQYPGLRRVQCIAFALAYIRRDCLARIGGLDEIFHSYFEDTDYCLRAADAGIATVMAGSVSIDHIQHGSTRDDGGFRARLFAASRERFAERWSERLRARQRGTVHWQGLHRGPWNAAHFVRSLLPRLEARDLRMAFSSVRTEWPDDQDFRLGHAARRSLPAQPEASLVCVPAEMRVTPRGRFRVGLVESAWTQAPAHWRQSARAFDLLLVGDAFQREAFRAAGVTTPIELLPIGVDRHYCHPDVPRLRVGDGRFVFLAIAETLERDAPERIVCAFRRAFAADADVELLIHCVPGNDADRLRAAVVAELNARSGARVRLLDAHGYPFHQRALLLAAADAYVSARRGGDRDPWAAEALACGRIVIAPAFGSQLRLVRDHGLAVALRGDGMHGPSGHGGCEPDEDSLVERLREASAQREALSAAAMHTARQAGLIPNIEATADALRDWLASGGSLKPAAPAPPAHRPAEFTTARSGQIVVLGMHRSGTSSIGGLLARMGAWPGADDELLAGPDNPRGHYEHAGLHGACLQRLAAAGGDWRHPPQASVPAAIDAFRREACVILDKLSLRNPWFIKEPRLCLIAGELLPLLDAPVFVLVVRHPAAIAASLERRDHMSRAEALALWEQYMRSALDLSDGWKRVFIEYEALLADPPTATRTFLQALAVAGVDGLHLPDAAVLRDWIRPDRETRPIDASGLSASQSALYQTLRAHCGASP